MEGGLESFRNSCFCQWYKSDHCFQLLCRVPWYESTTIKDLRTNHHANTQSLVRETILQQTCLSFIVCFSEPWVISRNFSLHVYRGGVSKYVYIYMYLVHCRLNENQTLVSMCQFKFYVPVCVHLYALDLKYIILNKKLVSLKVIK